MKSKTLKYVGIGAAASGVVGAIVSVIYLCTRGEHDDCEITIDDLSPLIILPGTTTIIYPKIEGNSLKFHHGQSVEFACPGNKVCVRTDGIDVCSDKRVFEDLSASCYSNESQLYCNSSIQSTVRYTGESCEANGSEIEVGFSLDSDRFARSIMICFDRENEIAHYTFITLTASIMRSPKVGRPKWIQYKDIYGIDLVEPLYERENQRKTINTLVGLDAHSTIYIKNDSYFLSRGHLTAKADMFYAAQQNATFFMGNIAPQWQTLNGGNWNAIENAIRKYANKEQVDLMVWTGVHGVASLLHEKTNKLVDLYLYVDELADKKVPVPALFWKVVYNPNSQEGIALIGVNNPYIENVEHICTDVLPDIDRLKKVTFGYCYACTIDSFRQTVKNMPKITVQGLLDIDLEKNMHSAKVY